MQAAANDIGSQRQRAPGTGAEGETMKIRTVLAAAALGATVLGSAGTASLAQAQATPTRGGDATIILGVDAVRGLDPAFLFNLTPSGDANRMAAIYGVLFWSDAKTGKVNASLGKSLTPDKTGATWTLVLNPGVAFTDGTPLDAAAVKFNYERIQNKATASPLAGLIAGAQFKVVDPLTLAITLAAPNMQFDKVLSTSLTHIASPKAITERPTDYAHNPVGAGPFMVGTWVKGDYQKLVRNPNYLVKGEPHLDSVTFRAIRDPGQRINTVLTGAAHAAIPGSDLAFAKSAQRSGLAVSSAPAGGGPMVMFNLKVPPFNEARARKAVQLALDVQDFAAVIDPGSSAPLSLYGPTSPFYPAKPAPVAQNKEAAQKLFDELAAEGKAVNFKITLTASGLFRRMAEYVQSRLSQFRNVTVSIEVVDNATLDKRVFRDRNYQFSAQIVPVADPEPNLYKLLRTDGQTNYMGYSNPAVDAALEAARATTDTAARADAYARIEKAVWADAPVIPVRNQEAYTVHAQSLKGLVLHGDGSLLYDRLWLSR